MANIATRKLQRSTAKKKEYLKKYGDRIKRGDKNVPTYAQWLKKYKVTGSKQHREGVARLSDTDYVAIKKRFGKSKYNRSKK